jgi:2-dehydro-3-deoxygalactonokinase
MVHDGAALIGLDWGGSRVRAYRFDAGGRVVETRTRPWGVLAAATVDFAGAYGDLTAGWFDPGSPVAAIACGMVGSTEGWIAVPYCACPAGIDELAHGLSRVDAPSGCIAIVPGVAMNGTEPDVMRGEETQVVGALALDPGLRDRATLVLPGTHAKWVAIRDGRIARFETYLTGELFAVLSEHSILGRPARRAAHAVTDTARGPDPNAFDRGVAAARYTRPRGIAPLLFRTRSLVLTDQLDAGASLDFLSGLLIGDEVRCGLADAAAPVVLVGEAALCERYARAFAAFGVSAPIVDDAAAAGLLAVARSAQLVSGSMSRA